MRLRVSSGEFDHAASFMHRTKGRSTSNSSDILPANQRFETLKLEALTPKTEGKRGDGSTVDFRIFSPIIGMACQKPDRTANGAERD